MMSLQLLFVNSVISTREYCQLCIIDHYDQFNHLDTRRLCIPLAGKYLYIRSSSLFLSLSHSVVSLTLCLSVCLSLSLLSLSSYSVMSKAYGGNVFINRRINLMVK